MICDQLTNPSIVTTYKKPNKEVMLYMKVMNKDNPSPLSRDTVSLVSLWYVRTVTIDRLSIHTSKYKEYKESEREGLKHEVLS